MDDARRAQQSGGPGSAPPGAPPRPDDQHAKGAARGQGGPDEASYLRRQQQDSGDAITRVVADMKDSVAQAADVREWTRQHPWVVAAGACAAGFVAGMLATPPKDESFKEYFDQKWEALKDRLTPPEPPIPGRGRATEAPPRESGILGTILKEVFRAVGPTLAGILTGSMAGPDLHEMAEAMRRAQQGDGAGGPGNPTDGNGSGRSPA